ncbi:MAG: universal stress protein [Bilophila sp.]
MVYSRILLPVDGSEHSMHAVVHALKLARQGGEIIIITVLPSIPSVIGGEARKEAEADVIKDSLLLTQPVADIIAAEKLPYQTKTIFANSPGNGIIKAITDLKADIVVMGSRGRNDLEGLFLGSVTHRVLTVSDVPVLVVH